MKRTINYWALAGVAIAFFYIGVVFATTLSVSARSSRQYDEPACSTSIPGTAYTAIAVTPTDPPPPPPPLPTDWPYTPSPTFDPPPNPPLPTNWPFINKGK